MVKSLPGPAVVGLLQLKHTPVNELIMMVTHQLGFAIENVNGFILLDKIITLYHPLQAVPLDIMVIDGDDAVRKGIKRTHETPDGIGPLLGETTVELIAAFGRGGTAKSDMGNRDIGGGCHLLDVLGYRLQTLAISHIGRIDDGAVHSEVYRKHRALLCP